MLTRNVGMLIVFIVGSSIDYHYTPCVFVFLPIVSGIIYLTLPNTPQFHLQRNQLKVKETALNIFRVMINNMADNIIFMSYMLEESRKSS